MKTLTIIFIVTILGIPISFAKKGITARAPAAVLNFDGDLIEAERENPDLFYQSNVEDMSLDSILYLRNDFNDYQRVDCKRKPIHIRQRLNK